MPCCAVLLLTLIIIMLFPRMDTPSGSVATPSWSLLAPDSDHKSPCRESFAGTGLGDFYVTVL